MALLGNPGVDAEYRGAHLHNDTGVIEKEVTTRVDNYNAMEKILVILIDMYGDRHYTKVVITDVDMMFSVLIAHDITETLKEGIYIVVGSSAKDLVAHKLILQ